LRFGLDQHPGVVGVKAARLGVADVVGQHRTAELGGGQRGAGAGGRHRHFFKAERKPRDPFHRRNAQIRAMDRPIHRADIDRRPRRVALQPLARDFKHRRGIHAGGDHQRLCRAVDPREVGVKIWHQPVEKPRAVKYRRSLPDAVIGGPHHRDIALVPTAFKPCADVRAK